MLIAHLTDTHLCPGTPVGERNAAHLEAAVVWLAELRPDLIVVSGDLSERGDLASYRELYAILHGLAMPVLLALGNHDRREPFRAAFANTLPFEAFLQYRVDLDDKSIIVLDTLDSGRSDGAFCDARAAWLDEELARVGDRPTLLVLHHPPCAVGIDWLDPPLGDSWTSTLGKIVSRHPQIAALVAGHLHLPVNTAWLGRPLAVAGSIAPASALELRPTDGVRAENGTMIVDSSPALALHCWTDTLVTHHVRLKSAGALVR